MRALVASGLVVSALLLAALPGEAAEPVLDVELPAGEVHVGDLVPLTLVLDPDGAELAAPPRFPAWGDGWGAAEVVETGEPASTIDEGGREVYRQRVVLQAFRPGELALPPVEVAVPLAEGTRTLATPADLAIAVASVLPPVPAEAGTEAEAIPPPQPAAPPMPLPVGAAFWWAAGIGAALLGAVLVTLLLRRRRGAEGAGARPLLAPVAELSVALAAARAAGSAEEGHERVSLALRRYLGRRLSFPAPESTTSEVQRQLLARHLPAGLPRRAVELLRACDLVMFARRPASHAEVERWAGEAEAVAAGIEAHLAPPEPAAAPGEAAA